MVNRNGKGKKYTIVGVLEDKDAIFALNFNDSVFIPYSTFEAKLNNSNNVDSYIFEVSDKLEESYDNLIGGR